MPFDGQTLLVISEIGVPLYSTRDAVQTLHPAQEALDVARTVNGTLVDLSDGVTFRKYLSEISATDFNPMAFDGLWPGMTLTIDCCAELALLTGGTPSRPVVDSYTIGSFTFYRPRIVFKLLDLNVSFREWASETTCNMSLAEV